MYYDKDSEKPYQLLSVQPHAVALGRPSKSKAEEACIHLSVPIHSIFRHTLPFHIAQELLGNNREDILEALSSSGFLGHTLRDGPVYLGIRHVSKRTDASRGGRPKFKTKRSSMRRSNNNPQENQLLSRGICDAVHTDGS